MLSVKKAVTIKWHHKSTKGADREGVQGRGSHEQTDSGSNIQRTRKRRQQARDPDDSTASEDDQPRNKRRQRRDSGSEARDMVDHSSLRLRAHSASSDAEDGDVLFDPDRSYSLTESGGEPSAGLGVAEARGRRILDARLTGDISYIGGVVYRAIHEERISLGLDQALCMRCPAFQFCKDSGPVNPQECVYYRTSLTGGVKIEVDGTT